MQTLAVDYVTHSIAGEHYSSPAQATEFLQRNTDSVGSMKNCNVILYQAGADSHINDPLSGWLTTEQLAERDGLVFETARSLSISVAWNLVGGYRTPLRKVLDIHDNTMRAAAAVNLTNA